MKKTIKVEEKTWKILRLKAAKEDKSISEVTEELLKKALQT